MRTTPGASGPCISAKASMHPALLAERQQRRPTAVPQGRSRRRTGRRPKATCTLAVPAGAGPGVGAVGLRNWLM